MCLFLAVGFDYFHLSNSVFDRMIHGIMKQFYHNVMGVAVWIFHIHTCQTHNLELCPNIFFDHCGAGNLRAVEGMEFTKG